MTERTDGRMIIERWLATEVCSLAEFGATTHEEEQRALLARLIDEALDAERARLGEIEQERDFAKQANVLLQEALDMGREERNGLKATIAALAEALRELADVSEHIGEELMPDPNDSPTWEEVGQLGEACKKARAALARVEGQP